MVVEMLAPAASRPVRVDVSFGCDHELHLQPIRALPISEMHDDDCDQDDQRSGAADRPHGNFGRLDFARSGPTVLDASSKNAEIAGGIASLAT